MRTHGTYPGEILFTTQYPDDYCAIFTLSDGKTKEIVDIGTFSFVWDAQSEALALCRKRSAAGKGDAAIELVKVVGAYKRKRPDASLDWKKEEHSNY